MKPNFKILPFQAEAALPWREIYGDGRLCIYFFLIYVNYKYILMFIKY
jgi:hypothetical protein